MKRLWNMELPTWDQEQRGQLMFDISKRSQSVNASGKVLNRVTKMAFAQVTKNLTNYPIARHPRTAIPWYPSKTKGRQYCRISDVVMGRMSTKHQGRNPDGFDFVVMLVLLRLAIMKGRSFKLPSRRDLLAQTGYANSGENWKKFQDALDLWGKLSLFHKAWYIPGTSMTEPKQLAPLIESLSGNSIKINRDWFESSQKYYCQVPLSLPRRSTPTLNLVIFLLTVQSNIASTTIAYEPGTLCEKLGILHSRRYEKLWVSIKQAKEWFKEFDGDLVANKVDGKVEFTVIRPQVGNRAFEPVKPLTTRIGDKLRTRRVNSQPLLRVPSPAIAHEDDYRESDRNRDDSWSGRYFDEDGNLVTDEQSE